jgi:hypothetical protein
MPANELSDHRLGASQAEALIEVETQIIQCMANGSKQGILQFQDLVSGYVEKDYIERIYPQGKVSEVYYHFSGQVQSVLDGPRRTFGREWLVTYLRVHHGYESRRLDVSIAQRALDPAGDWSSFSYARTTHSKIGKLRYIRSKLPLVPRRP